MLETSEPRGIIRLLMLEKTNSATKLPQIHYSEFQFVRNRNILIFRFPESKLRSLENSDHSGFTVLLTFVNFVQTFSNPVSWQVRGVPESVRVHWSGRSVAEPSDGVDEGHCPGGDHGGRRYLRGKPERIVDLRLPGSGINGISKPLAKRT